MTANVIEEYHHNMGKKIKIDTFTILNRRLTSLSCVYVLIRANGGTVKAKGTIYLSNIRMVFVANKPVGGFVAFDMPLVWTSDNNMLIIAISSLIFYEIISRCVIIVEIGSILSTSV